MFKNTIMKGNRDQKFRQSEYAIMLVYESENKSV